MAKPFRIQLILAELLLSRAPSSRIPLYLSKRRRGPETRKPVRVSGPRAERDFVKNAQRLNKQTTGNCINLRASVCPAANDSASRLLNVLSAAEEYLFGGFQYDPHIGLSGRFAPIEKGNRKLKIENSLIDRKQSESNRYSSAANTSFPLRTVQLFAIEPEKCSSLVNSAIRGSES